MLAKELEALLNADPERNHFFQKWTCQHCGSRQTMNNPDRLYAQGSCEECGNLSQIPACGYMFVKSNHPITALEDIGA